MKKEIKVEGGGSHWHIIIGVLVLSELLAFAKIPSSCIMVFGDWDMTSEKVISSNERTGREFVFTKCSYDGAFDTAGE